MYQENRRLEKYLAQEEKSAVTIEKHIRDVRFLCAFILQTICETVIRVSELKYISAEVVEQGSAIAESKNKTGVIFIPSLLQKFPHRYIKKTGITHLRRLVLCA